MLVFSAVQLVAFGMLFAAGYTELRTGVFPLLEDHLRERAATTATSLASQLDVALGADDQKLVETIASTALRDPDLGAIEIDNALGSVVYRSGDVTTGLPGRADIQIEGLHLGSITVAFDTARVDRLRRFTSGLAAVVLALWLAAAVTSLAFSRTLVAPIRAMMEFARRVADGDFAGQLDVAANTRELRELRDHLNAMTSDLAAREREAQANAAREVTMQRDLVEASRYAGMAEVATGVLHNVGNVLNSLSVAASVIADRVRGARGDALARTVALFNEHPDGLAGFVASPRGGHLADYLAALGNALSDDAAQMRKEIGEVLAHIGHIKTIVSAQQAYALMSGMRERVDLPTVVADALRLGEASFVRHGIEVVRECGDVPMIVTDRHKLLQIIVNLISNARDALLDAHGTMRLTVRIEPRDAGVAISVIDSGAGIADEVRKRIFQHGFTTKKHGHGFGLHASANSARELGGSLVVASDGPGRGATFTLELPTDLPEKRYAQLAA
jgi:signal transduction histidine kinase